MCNASCGLDESLQTWKFAKWGKKERAVDLSIFFVYNKTNIIGLAKKLEEVYFPNDSMPILLNKKSYYLKLLQQIRNEAHRFAINYHKDLRSKNFLKSGIESITGIGEKTRLKLINKFGSIAGIKKANKKDLEDTIGQKKTADILRYLEE